MLNLKEEVQKLKSLEGKKVTATFAENNGFFKGALKHHLDGSTEKVAKAYTHKAMGELSVDVAKNLAESKITVGDVSFPLLSLSTDPSHQAGLVSLNCGGRNMYYNPVISEYRGAYYKTIDKVFDRESVKFMQEHVYTPKETQEEQSK